MTAKRRPGLEGDLGPIIRLMKATGMWIFEYYDEYGGAVRFLRKVFAAATTILLLSQFGFMVQYFILESFYKGNLASTSVTVTFFSQSLFKYAYFAFRSRMFYRTFGFWNKTNSHPLFVESSNRYRLTALKRMTNIIRFVGGFTILTVFLWTGSASADTLVHYFPSLGSADTSTMVNSSLVLNDFYVWDSSSGMEFAFTFLYQFVFLLFSLSHVNLIDMMLCCVLIYSCEQLNHLKDILKPVIDLSVVPDDQVPNVADVFRARLSADSFGMHRSLLNDGEDELSYSNSFSKNEFMNGNIKNNEFNNMEIKKRDVLLRSAIKYWVERHKKVVKFVNLIGECFGFSLLIHMLIATLTLTILTYQTTKISEINMYAASTLGYLFYSLGHIFMLSFYGNELQDESGSVMEAAYSCQWYEGSEAAKTFVQVVSQQTQKSMVLTGAKFFTVSMDMFASTLGAVITYFMVLIQLK